MSRLIQSLPSWKELFPFLTWFPLPGRALRADVIAGVTAGLLAIPQSMAYAQLAGLPAYLGLYAAFLPVFIGAMWGSSSHLVTGPAAVAALLTASALAPFAIPGSEYYITLAIALALLVGIMQFALGASKLGAAVSFLSHPVIAGFTNAAAIIIALSQLNKLLGVPVNRSEYFFVDIWEVLKLAGDTHIPTLLLGLSAFIIMWGFKKYAPKLPGVLIAVAITTAVSWAIEFERTASVNVDQLMHPIAKQLAREYVPAKDQIEDLNTTIFSFSRDLKEVEETAGEASQAPVHLRYQIGLLKVELAQLQAEQRERQRQLSHFRFDIYPGPTARPELYLTDLATRSGKPHPESWRIRKIEDKEIALASGGEVVGWVPSGVPSIELPKLDWPTAVSLLTTAFVIALFGFIEAISIAKAIAAKTRERIDPNQELIGQGLANIAASLTHSFPVSGSFSRSALNLNAGAVTGMSSVFSGLIMLLTLLFLTPLLYYLPQSVLAAVIMMAVVGLINFKAIQHAWEAHKHDGIAAAVTFAAALVFAPHLDTGILTGAGLALILYLYRSMRPRVVLLKPYSDSLARAGDPEEIRGEREVVALRFDGSLYFANVPYFEDAVLTAVAAQPEAKYLLVVGDGIHELDASGEEVIRHLAERLSSSGVTLVFSGLKREVIHVMQKTGLYPVIGAQHFFRNEQNALEAIDQWLHDSSFAVCALPAPESSESPG
ncbi:MAG TPA: SulP family inorganic anion transporter [Burkholderiales bacterium]|nr:SulP family inorganic anion transporter [Burkholderiales bacterium]